MMKKEPAAADEEEEEKHGLKDLMRKPSMEVLRVWLTFPESSQSLEKKKEHKEEKREQERGENKKRRLDLPQSELKWTAPLPGG